MKFFARFAENVEITKMSVNNIAIVIGPNLLWPLDDDALVFISVFFILNLYSEYC